LRIAPHLKLPARSLDCRLIVNRRIVPLVKSAHAQQRSVAPACLNLFRFRTDFQTAHSPSTHHDYLFGLRGRARRIYGCDANAILAGAQANAYEGEG
jgi:hypothetical protein